jgi:hypothetical protein
MHSNKLDSVMTCCGNGILRDVSGYLRDVSDSNNPVCYCLGQGTGGYDIMSVAVRTQGIHL